MAVTTQSPTFISRMRRLSKSNFDFESSSKSPRLDKMVAHINLFDKTTKVLEDELAEQRRNTLAESRMTKTRGGRPRPGVPSRGSEYVHQKGQDVPNWVTDLTNRPSQNCVVVIEVEQVEDVLSP